MASKETTPDAIESAIRKSAASLAEAITKGRQAGYAVTWPGRVEDLESIQISQTGRVVVGEGKAQDTSMSPVAVDGRVERFTSDPVVDKADTKDVKAS